MKRMAPPSRTTPDQDNIVVTSTAATVSSSYQLTTNSEENHVDTRTAATVSVSLQLNTASEDRTTMREYAKLARIGDTLGDCLVKQERVDDRRTRCDLSRGARHGGHSAPRAHRGQERFSSHFHRLCLESEMLRTSNWSMSVTHVLVGSWTCSYVGNPRFTSCSMRCLTTLAQPTVSPAMGEAEASMRHTREW